MNAVIKNLKIECPFPEVFSDIEEGSQNFAPVYRRKLGHIRADHDGYRWWNTWWPCHEALCTKDCGKEIDAVYDALIGKGGFPGLNALRRFCEDHPEARIGEACDGEYNFYYEGKLCLYWIRLITREQDYNIYLHAFLKEVP